jgi:toxin YhaV
MGQRRKYPTAECSKSDPYGVFEKMLGRGNPPDDRDALIAATRSNWGVPKA